jgi:hypothetical protein
MDELARLAHPYYNQFARGGEGHLEVAKNIYYTVSRKAHMVLSLKPFGCMPSSQSDGGALAVPVEPPHEGLQRVVPHRRNSSGKLVSGVTAPTFYQESPQSVC